MTSIGRNVASVFRISVSEGIEQIISFIFGFIMRRMNFQYCSFVEIERIFCVL